jgi:hypothetical protein
MTDGTGAMKVRSAFLLAILWSASCARETSPPALDPRPPAAPLPMTAVTAVAPPTASPSLASRGAEDWYTRDVWVVETPPSAVFLLARITEPPGDDCEARLFAHARGLGANRLYIDRSQSCGGAAYTVRNGATAERLVVSGGRGGGVTDGEEIAAWVRARWTRPASISAEDAKRLCVVVQFTVSPMRRIWNVRAEPIQSSGNREFDESVRRTLESAIDERATVPAPPRDLVGEHVVYRVEVSETGACRPPR